MSEPAAPAAKAPAPPPAAPAPAPQQAAPAAAPAATGPLSESEQRQLASLLTRQQAVTGAGDPVRLKVTGPHVSLSYGGLTVGTEFTTVPASMVAAFTEAAADAGVEITQES